MRKFKKISIIIPVYNEEKTIVSILDKVINAKIKLKKEIVIVNDGSKDLSEKVIKEYINKNKAKADFILLSKENGGKGSAIRAGIDKVRGDLLVIQDADLEYEPEEINLLINVIESGDADVVYGSRMLKKNPYSYLSYYLGNYFLSLATSILYGARITDMETCYKLVPIKIMRELKLCAKKFDIEPEITAKIMRRGYKIKEVPISYIPRSKEDGKKINWKDGVVALWYLVKHRFMKS